MTILLDYDWAVYRACFGAKDKDLIQTLETLDYYTDDIIRNLGGGPYRMFLSGSTNFRYSIASDYKANRIQEKPKFYHEVRDYLVQAWRAELSDGMEADDLCGINQTQDTIIVGEDKDLLTIPGKHYRIKKDWLKNQVITVSEEEAMKFFWTQCLTGDKSDNIKGIYGIGPIKADKLLHGLSSTGCKTVVTGIYQDTYGDKWYKAFDKTCSLLWIKRDLTKTYKDYI